LFCYAYCARIFYVRAFVILGRRCFTISNKELLINEEIKEKEVRVIGADGSQLGVMSSKDALKKAVEADLDLVLIAPNATPPVCRVMDYGKYCFEQAKREKEAKKNQKVVDIKEIRLGLSIDTHDFETKGNHAKKFLQGGDKVKVSIRFRGRELGHPEIGTEIMARFADFCAEFAVVEKPAKMEGRSMLMFLAPKPTK
jgi:translation initiation factor IF-3